MGFNPTDDGFNLAYSRRILEGQIPHRDFIAIRPVGTALLHLLVVWLGGEATFWWSRAVVWFEFACIAWAWVAIAGRMLHIVLPIWERMALGIIGFTLCAHTFPVIAWYTTDALLLTTIGLLLALRPSSAAKFTGYLLIGGAYLCKQSFLLLPLAGLFLLGDWRRARYWVAVALPGALYVSALAVLGALRDAFLQLTAQHDLVTGGILPYTRSLPLLTGLVAGYVILALLHGKPSIRGRTLPLFPRRALGMLFLAATVLHAAYRVPSWRYLAGDAYRLMGAVAGATIFFLLGDPGRRRFARMGLLVLAVAWTTSVALAYRTPALATGLLALFLITISDVRVEGATVVAPWRAPAYATAFLAVVCGVMFVPARSSHIYRERPWRELDRPLGEVWPGGRGIRIDARTYEFLSEFNAVRSGDPQRKTVIIGEMCGYWVKAPQPNVLPIDWPNSDELRTKLLEDRVERDLKRLHGSIRVVVQKVSAAKIATGTSPLEAKCSLLIPFVRENFARVGETRYFEIYE